METEAQPTTNENNENTEILEVTTPSSKGIKRNANSPLEGDVKKQKVVSREPSLEIIDDAETNPSMTPKTPKTPKLTKEEREQLRLQKLEEKERQRLEREKALEEKRQEKERFLLEKKLEKEKKEKERLEKKLEEEKKKEDKKREIEEEKAKKKREEDEKKEAKRKEEEEKKEAKRKEEEAVEEKKRRESARFIGFFSKVEKKKVAEVKNVDDSLWYRPFELKDGMTMAPILMRQPIPSDIDLLEQLKEVDNLTYLKSEKVKNRSIVSSNSNKLKAKLFQFHDNRRPPYYGTWRKKPVKISGRRSCRPVEPGIDYEIESDDEWEDEPSDGEECRSDDEDERDDDDDVMSDDGFFVPPCYLSDGEGEEEEEDGSDVERGAEKQRRVVIDSDGEEGDGEAAARDKTKRGGGKDGEDRKARLASRAKEWSRCVSRGGNAAAGGAGGVGGGGRPSATSATATGGAKQQLVSRCIGPCYEEQKDGGDKWAQEFGDYMMAVRFF